MKNFEKNDNGFVCAWCGKQINPLGYTSRDHCTHCLTSLHVDINPGDRANACCGHLIPIDITINSKKGLVINYRCQRCGQLHNNKTAEDDSKVTILKVMNKTYDANEYKKTHI